MAKQSSEDYTALDALGSGAVPGALGALSGATLAGLSPEIARKIPSDKLRLLLGVLGGGALGASAGIGGSYLGHRLGKHMDKQSAESTSGSSSSNSGYSSVEGPKTTTSFNTPSTGHMGVFKGTGMANTSRIKVSAFFRRGYEDVMHKFALGIQQPNMITKSLRSAAGREGGYTAGNLAKGSGAFKPTRATATFSEGKSSAMDKL